MSLHNSAITNLIGSSGTGSGGGGGGGSSGHYNGAITKSARFDRTSDTQGGYFKRATASRPADSTTEMLYAISFWVKFPTPAVFSTERHCIMHWGPSGSGAHRAFIEWYNLTNSTNNNGSLRFRWNNGSSAQLEYKTNIKFIDCTNWYHLYFFVNGSIGKIEGAGIVVNGVLANFQNYNGSYVSGHQNILLPFGRVVDVSIGRHNGTEAGGNPVTEDTGHFGGYLADINVIEGQTPAPTYFGEFKNGVWIPKDIATTDFKKKTEIAHGVGTVLAGNFNTRAANSSNGNKGTGITMANSAQSPQSASAWIGKDWGAGQTKKITGYRVYPSTDQGFAVLSGYAIGNLTFQLYGSNSAPTSYQDGTLIHQSMKTDNNYTNDGYNGLEHHYTENGLYSNQAAAYQWNNMNNYRYHWIALSNDSGNNPVWYVGELVFFEEGTDGVGTAGTHGVHGFRLQFLQTGTGQDANGLGADTSGNNEHFAIQGP